MSRYTSATDADRQEMLEAIGVDTIDDLFADVPEGVRLGRALDLPPGKPEQEVYARLRDLAAKNTSAEDELSLPRRRDVRPLRPRADRLDPAALGVPDSVHALPARDQPGRAAGDVRVPDGDLRADRACRSPTPRVYEGPSAVAAAGWLAHTHTKKTTLPGLRGPAPALARDARDDVRGLGHDDRDDLARRRPHRPGRGRRRRRGDLRRAAELLRRDRGPRGAVGGQERRAADRPGRPADARRAQAPGRVRRRHRRRRGPDARQPAGLRRPELRLLRRQAGLHPPHAGPDRGRDDRRRRPPRLRAHAADARAAHPPREGHAQHLHGPGAERAGGHDLPELARPRGDRRARRAAGRAHALRARDADRDRRHRGRPRPAGRARVRAARAERRTT